MHIEWQWSTPLGTLMPKRSPTRGLLENDEELREAGRYLFTPDVPPAAGKRSIDPAIGEQLVAWHREVAAPPAAVSGAEALAAGAPAVVTAHQTCLLGGPLFTILKALTAVRVARDLSGRTGRPVVPVFWAEAEDDDLEEINGVGTLGRDYRVRRFELPVAEEMRGSPAGFLPLAGASGLVEDFFAACGETEFTADLKAGVLQDLEGAGDLSRWFCRQMLRLLGDLGLVVFDSRDRRFKEAARSFWVGVIEDPLALTESVRAAAERISGRGYHPVIVKEKHRCPFFMIAEGRREAVLFKRGTFRVADRRYTHLELRRRLDDRPWDFSPSVHLRPLLQDTLLPTAAYVGGPTELGYFLQVLPGYRWAGIPAPAVVQRLSLTLVEPAVRKILVRQSHHPMDLRRGIDGALSAVLRRENTLASEARWEKLRGNILRPLERFANQLSSSEKDLAELAQKTAGKVDFQVRDLEKRAVAALRRRSDVLREQLTRSRERLFPDGALQERTLSPFYFMNKYGPDLIGVLDGSSPADFTEHHFGTIIP